MAERATLSDEFAAAYRAHVDFVWRVLARRGVLDEQLEDATQEVFVIMHRRWGAWGSGSPRAWLYGVARRVAATQHRARRRRHRKLAALPAPAEPPLADEQLADRRRLDALARAIEQLDPERRDVLVLIEIEGLSAPEVAAALGCKLNTVYSRLRRARASIARAMAEFDADDPSPAVLGKELHGSAR
ncbi:MAG TPA: sigma-70 family RNA polymerase sigma factor [Enhygromyxa sp.]|nr:sigma-70 family RNA polymerase sigma factor [Enhygromyxa sp.]